MRVLVTGHLGYIGGILLPMLQSRGHEVTGCDVNIFADCRFLPETVDCDNLATDVRDLSSQQIAGYDAIIHLAGLSNDPLGNFRPSLTYDINQAASVRLAIMAKKSGAGRFLFASSCSNYGASSGALLDESAPFNPVTPYGESKAGAETTITGLAAPGFSTCNLRAGTVYGVAPRIRFDLVLNNLVAHAVSSGRILLKSDGQAWRPLVHVSDVAQAYACALDTPAEVISGQAFNVGLSNENYRIHELAEKIHRSLPDTDLVLEEGAINDHRSYRVNCDRINRVFDGYRPGWNVDDGIVELVRSFGNHPVSSEDIEGARFSRLAHLRQHVAAGRLDEELRFSR